MHQKRLHSFIESIVNVIVGLVVNFTGQLIIFPLFDIHIPLTSNLGICAFFTAISITRSYCLRRWFTKRTECEPKLDKKSDYNELLQYFRNLEELKNNPLKILEQFDITTEQGRKDYEEFMRNVEYL